MTTTPGIASSQVETYLHDALGRLSSDLLSDGTAALAYYDRTGNITATYQGPASGPLLAATYAYTYGAIGAMTPTGWLPNELVALLNNGTNQTTRYGYDRNGDTTAITTTGSPTSTTSLSYDAAGRLSGVLQSSASGMRGVQLAYNARGLRRTYSVTTTGQTLPLLQESLSYWGEQVGQVVVTGTATTPFTETFLYRPDGSPLELLVQSQDGQGHNQATARYWYVLDGQGSVVALTDVSGNVVDRYAYDPWGEVLPSGSSESVPQRLRYAGYWYDEELEWYWVNVRSYDPEGRWLQPDQSEIDGVRTYVYVGDDPIDLTDSSGLGTCSGSHDVLSFLGDVACNAGNFVGNVGQGAWNGVLETTQGLGSLAHGAWNSTVVGIYDPQAFGAQWQANAALATYIWHHPVAAGEAVVTGIVAPCGNTIRSGNVGRAIGRCGFDLAMFVVGTKGLTKVAELSGVGRVSRITRLLQQHVNVASTRYTLTPAQLAAIARNPALEAAYRGDRIDALAKQLVANDPRLRGIVITRRGQFGADFYDAKTGRWWDITTPAQWARHVAK